MILGNGGATAAVKYVLQKLGIQFSIVSRNPVDNSFLSYEDLSEEIIQQNFLIINTSPVGMYPHVEDYPKIPYQFLSDEHYLFDLIYNPAETSFLKKKVKSTKQPLRTDTKCL